MESQGENGAAIMDRPSRPLCRHCHRLAGTKPRGLCHCCYFIPELRVLYEPGRQVNPLSNLHAGKFLPLPSEPTNAIPGTEEKVQVMEGRDKRGEQIRHPLDAYVDWTGHVVYPALGGRPWHEYYQKIRPGSN